MFKQGCAWLYMNPAIKDLAERHQAKTPQGPPSPPNATVGLRRTAADVQSRFYQQSKPQGKWTLLFFFKKTLSNNNMGRMNAWAGKMTPGLD